MTGFVIWTIVAVFFLGVGVKSRRSEKAAGFWSNAKPPEVTDIRAYNRAVSRIWFFFAAGFELLGLPLLFCEQNDPRVLIAVFGTIFLVIGIMISYIKVENKYRKK